MARLWQKTQKVLFLINRDVGKKLIRGLVEELEVAEREGRRPEVFVKRWREQLGNMELALESGALDFRHPFFVGPFAVVGSCLAPSAKPGNKKSSLQSATHPHLKETKLARSGVPRVILVHIRGGSY